MKIAHFFALAVATVLSLTNVFAATERKFAFDTLPYSANTSVVGLDGWTAAVIDSGDNNDAMVVDLAHAPNGRALRITSSSTQVISRRRTSISNTFGSGNEVSGPLQIKMSVAFDTTNLANGSSAIIGFHPTNNNTPPLLIAFTPNKGIYLALGSPDTGSYPGLDDTTLVSSSLMKMGSFYDFTIDIDYDSRTFDLTLTGLDKDDNIINITRSGIGFQSTASNVLKSINGIRIENYRGDLITVDIAHISIVAIPEPKLGALMLMGAGGALAFFRRRSHRKQTPA